MMSVSTLFIGLNVVSSVSICLVILGSVVGLVDFLANAICRRPSVCRLSLCNVRAPYSGD